MSCQRTRRKFVSNWKDKMIEKKNASAKQRLYKMVDLVVASGFVAHLGFIVI